MPKARTLLFLVISITVRSSTVSERGNLSDFPFRNVSLSFEERVQDLVKRLTLDEVVDQMAHGGAKNNGPAPAITRLGIKPYQWGTECLSGDVRAGPATSFPMPIGLAASFNYDLIYNVSNAIGMEVRAKNNNATAHNDYSFHTGLSCWSPVVNIMRDPRWGRNQETFGEDPWLSGYLAEAFVKGLQGNNSRYLQTNAGCKHFDVHGGPENIPVSRFTFDAKVSERDWRMTFLPQFKSCVEAGSWSLMCSYNSINGIPACANSKLLTDILRNEWEFKGYVVSDEYALVRIYESHKYTDSLIDAAVAAAKAGTCLEDGRSEDKSDNAFANLGDAVRMGKIEESFLRDAVSRLFMVRMKLGEFDPPDMNPYTKLTTDIIQSEQHKNLSLRAALESFVLLKIYGHLDNQTVKSGSYHQSCIVGPFIDNPELYFGDYSPDDALDSTITVLEGFRKYSFDDKITSAEGCLNGVKCTKYNQSAIVEACEGADRVIITVGLGRSLESEGHDRSDLNLPGYQHQLMMDAAIISPVADVFLIIFSAGPVNITWAVEHDDIGTIMLAFYPGQSAGEAIAMALGGYSPGGKLPFTWPTSLSQVPSITDYSMAGRTYRYLTEKPLFSFGFGLAYSRFKYSDLKINPTKIKAGEYINVSVTVGSVNQLYNYLDEVTQVYLEWDASVKEAPIRQLVAVSRNTYKSYTPRRISLIVHGNSMKVYTTQWEIPTGVMTVHVGGQQPGENMSSRSNVLTGTFTVE